MDNYKADVPLDDLEGDWQSAQAGEGALKDDTYQMRIEQAEIRRTRSNGDRYIRWQLRIAEGPFKGRQLTKISTLEKPRALQALRNDLRAINAAPASLAALPQSLERVTGSVITVRRKSDNDGREWLSFQYPRKAEDTPTTPAEAEADPTPSEDDFPF